VVTVVVEGHDRVVLEAGGFIVVRMIRASELTMFNGGGRAPWGTFCEHR
jgi:hypothetical protein